jgi:hypothetical protein
MAAIVEAARVGGKLASWRGTGYCNVVRSTQEVGDGVHFPGYFRVQIGGFHDLLRQKPSSLFILYGWSSVSMASLMMRSMYLVFVESMEVLLNMVFLVDAVLSYSQLVRIFQTDVAFMFFQSGVDGAARWRRYDPPKRRFL